MDTHNTLFNWTINGVAISAIFSSLLGFIPAFAALIAAGYYLVQIWESETVRQWRSERRMKRIAKVRAQLKVLEDNLQAQLKVLEATDPLRRPPEKT